MIDKAVLYSTFTASGHEDMSAYFQRNLRLYGKLSLCFHHVKQKENSSLEIYSEGKLVLRKKYFTPRVKNPGLRMLLLPLIYAIHFITCVRAAFLARKFRFQAVIGLNFFCAWCNLFIRRIAGISKTVYYAADFYPLPPKGVYRRLIPFFYYFDKKCLNKSDIVWYINPRQYEERKKMGFFKNPKTIHRDNPVSVLEENILRDDDLREPAKPSISFIGVLSKSQGINLVLEILPGLIRAVGNVEVRIVGSGVFENELRKMAEDLGITGSVVFHGFVKEDSKVREILKDSSIGVAMYADDPYGFIQFGDSGKIKMYLSLGLPVVTTRVATIHKLLLEERAGYVVDYSAEEFQKALTEFFGKKEQAMEYKKNALRLIRNYECGRVLGPLLEDL